MPVGFDFDTKTILLLTLTNRQDTTIVDQATTPRRHLQVFHSVGLIFTALELHVYASTYYYQGRYRKWAQDTNFESKLPGDILKRKAAAEQVTRTLDRDLREKKPAERIVKYSDCAFHQAAIEWLVASDQASRRICGIAISHVLFTANPSSRSSQVP